MGKGGKSLCITLSDGHVLRVSKMLANDLETAIALALRAYDMKEPAEHVANAIWLQHELAYILSLGESSIYKPILLKAKDDKDGMVGFAGLVESPMMDDCFEFRLGTVDPAWQRRGVMTALTGLRLQILESYLNGRCGMVLNAAHYPDMYVRDFGFTKVVDMPRFTLLNKVLNRGNQNMRGENYVPFHQWANILIE